MRIVFVLISVLLPFALFGQGSKANAVGDAPNILDEATVVSSMSTDTTPSYVLSGEYGELTRIPVVEGSTSYHNEVHPTNSSMYTLTTSYGYCTNIPTITLETSGVYLISANVAMRYDTATFLSGREATAIVKRTNFGEAQISPTYSGRVYFPKQLTAARGQAGYVTIPFVYTATHDGETLQVWAKIERLPNNSPVGNAFVYHGDIVAIKLDP